MKQAGVYVHDIFCGILKEKNNGKRANPYSERAQQTGIPAFAHHGAYPEPGDDPPVRVW